jgi:hypothetical protein
MRIAYPYTNTPISHHPQRYAPTSAVLFDTSSTTLDLQVPVVPAMLCLHYINTVAGYCTYYRNLGAPTHGTCNLQL